VQRARAVRRHYLWVGPRPSIAVGRGPRRATPRRCCSRSMERRSRCRLRSGKWGGRLYCTPAPV
jgi:hypothetical protein